MNKLLKALQSFEKCIENDTLVCCKKCKYLKYSYEHSINLSFVEKTNPNDLEDVNHHVKLCSDGCGVGLVCSNEVCFETVNFIHPIYGKQKTKNRINGQGMLNYNNDCKYFKERTDLIYIILKWIKK